MYLECHNSFSLYDNNCIRHSPSLNKFGRVYVTTRESSYFKTYSSALPRMMWYESEMITIWFAGWISGRIVSLQPDTDIQNLLWNRNRIRIRISETLLLIFQRFRLLENVAHCTIIRLLSSFRSIFSAICAMTPSLSMVYSLYHSVISFSS